MRSTARKQEPRIEVRQELGTVARVEGASFVTHTEAGEHRARRATSCLLEPTEGDLVLLAVTTSGQAYVLAILEREAGAAGSIVADGDLDIKLGNGRFGVVAQEGVELLSGKDVSVVSGGLRVRAVDGSIALERLSFLGDIVRAEIAKAKLLAGTFDAIVERLSQRVKRAYRVVEETDHLRAEQVDYVAKKTMNLRGENTLVTAEELVKIDGDQIHLG
jgi:hypothetical protein